jgi:hypothetical protein
MVRESWDDPYARISTIRDTVCDRFQGIPGEAIQDGIHVISGNAWGNPAPVKSYRDGFRGNVGLLHAPEPHDQGHRVPLAHVGSKLPEGFKDGHAVPLGERDGIGVVNESVESGVCAMFGDIPESV